MVTTLRLVRVVEPLFVFPVFKFWHLPGAPALVAGNEIGFAAGNTNPDLAGTAAGFAVAPGAVILQSDDVVEVRWGGGF